MLLLGMVSSTLPYASGGAAHGRPPSFTSSCSHRPTLPDLINKVDLTSLAPASTAWASATGTGAPCTACLRARLLGILRTDFVHRHTSHATDTEATTYQISCLHVPGSRRLRERSRRDVPTCAGLLPSASFLPSKQNAPHRLIVS
jgi:hypothetical protein